MRRRTLRPSSRTTLVLITMILATIAWVLWELGRSVTQFTWQRSVLVITSGLTLVLFAIGDYLQ